MKFEDVYQTIPGNGWLTETEARLLWDSAKVSDVGVGEGLEVGCYKGRSACLLAPLFETLHCVDPFKEFDSDDPFGGRTMKVFQDNLRERGVRNCLLRPYRIEEINVMPPVRFAYLDGDHTYEGTLRQVLAAVRFGAKTFCVHDYAESGDGLAVKKALIDLQIPVVKVVERMALCRLR